MDAKVTFGDTALEVAPFRDLPEDRAVLVAYSGDVGELTTRVVELPEGAEVTVGRSRSATILVDSDRVSRIHAAFTRSGNDVIVEDRGSRNGTWVNGKQVTSQMLVSGDEVVIGPTTIVVSVTSRVVTRRRIEGARVLEERIAAEVDRGQRYRRSCALVMLRLGGDPGAVDAAIDRIADLVNPMDTCAEYTTTELGILLPELDSRSARDAAERLATAAREAGAEVAIGIAAYPDHGTNADMLIARANASIDAHDQPPAPPLVTGEVVVHDPQMQRVYELARKVASHPSLTVLVCGETGVGKEVVASVIHDASERRSGPLVRLNCASLPETLLESELFGHERGAFTGADRRKQGYFEAAEGGTLFLDEIGELSPATQAKLLRVLEQRRIVRVGGTEEIEVDVRVVCATNRDLEAEANRGAFRADLFFRISAFTILIPPLRDRRGEILALAEHFIDQACDRSRRPRAQLSNGAGDALRSYAWPGNVRELRNAIERALVLQTHGVIELDDLPERVRDANWVSPVTSQHVDDRVAEVERMAIVAALDASHGNQTEAAKKLGLSRRTLIYRMEKYGLKPLPLSERKKI